MITLARIKVRIKDCETYNFGLRNADQLAHHDAPRMAAALEAVLELHKPERDTDGETWCYHCASFWPCSSATAIRTALESRP